jgi:hypothetical protein
MIDPRVVIDETVVRVEPGGRATVGIKILNPGDIVEGYEISVLGAAAGWATAEPAEVSVFPGGEATAQIAFEPPVSAGVRAGTVAFGVRVRSKVDSTYATVVEGDVEVGAFRNIDATIGPKTSRGRRAGKHHVDMTNWGNEPVLVEITGADPDERLGFAIKSPVLELPVGGGKSVNVTVRPAGAVLRGPITRLPFTITVRQAGAAPDDESAWRRDLDATFEQRPLIPGWVMLLIPLIAIAIAAAVWWTSREENVESSSREEAAQPPSAPAAIEVVPAGPATITVTWPAVDGAESYNVLWVEPATRDAPTPTVFETTTVPGSQNSTRIEEGLEPGTEYCFQLQAVNAAGESAPTAPQCATTLSESGAAAPGDLVVTHLTDDHSRAEVSWTDTTGGESEHVVLHDGAPLASPIPAGQTSVAVELAQGENCFQVFSQDGDEASEMSEEVCIEGPSADGGTDGTGTTTGAGTGGDLGFIAVVFSTQIGDAGAAQAAEARRAQLEEAGFAAEVLNSLDYDAIPDGADGDGSLLVYVGGFETRDAAVAFCDANADQFATGCLYYQPGEPST